MPEARGPKVFSIPVYRSFADALVTGILATHGRDRMALARGMILVPNNRAIRAVTDAFVRRAENGLLLPRIVAIGDAGEAPGVALDGIASEIPPAVDPLTRRMILARLVQQERSLIGQRVGAAEAVRLATELGGTLDELIAEDRTPSDLRELDVGPELAGHWQKSLDLFATVITRWPEELAKLDRIDLPERRNRLLRGLANRWRDTSPDHFVIAAGVTSSAKAIADLLAVVARLPDGSVILPGLDLASPDAEWEAIAGDDTRAAIETHPQHHLRLLLDRIGVARAEVVRWRWGDGKPRKAVRGRAVSNAFAPARFTSKWIDLPSPQRSLKGVRLATFAAPADEAQGIAIALREALETPERTAALVTPDRGLAGRVGAHLRRWGIEADDSAGQPLAAMPVGVLIQAIAALGVERFAPTALLAVLKHPLVRSGEDRLPWLDGVRRLDLALRGPRPAPGLAGLAAWLRSGNERESPVRDRATGWWTETVPLFADFEAAFGTPRASFGDLLAAIRTLLETLGGESVWAGPAGRAAADLFAELEARHDLGPADFTPDDLLPLLRQLLGEQAIRPPQGGHPRISIYGLIEARLQQADLLVLGGLNEGSWPAATGADPWLSPRVRRELGLADPERRVGLAAHDLAVALGAGEVLMTRSIRDARSATIASRFLLRLEAMTGGLEKDERLPALVTAIDANPGAPEPALRPAPSPPVAERPRRISVTEVDRLKADPYAFYARAMLRLSPLDAVDADPGPAWRGSAVHAVLDAWMREDKLYPDKLLPRIDALLNEPGVHPIVRTLWEPRLVEACQWVADRIGSQRIEDHREPFVSEVKGTANIAGIDLSGIADRIDRLDEGTLAIVDYKTGSAPSGKAVAAGYSMQLGLLAAIAECGGFDLSSSPPRLRGGAGGGTSFSHPEPMWQEEEVPPPTPPASAAGGQKVTEFEYWSLTKNGDSFGKASSPVGGRAPIAKEDFVAHAIVKFTEAADRWLTGSDAFTAKLHPEYAPYEDYDQLMRRDEWYGRED
jgi:ATP-dependent helicase/nuclease subunit B